MLWGGGRARRGGGGNVIRFIGFTLMYIVKISNGTT